MKNQVSMGLFHTHCPSLLTCARHVCAPRSSTLQSRQKDGACATARRGWSTATPSAGAATWTSVMPVCCCCCPSVGVVVVVVVVVSCVSRPVRSGIVIGEDTA